MLARLTVLSLFPAPSTRNSLCKCRISQTILGHLTGLNRRCLRYQDSAIISYLLDEIINLPAHEFFR
jgi:hypothetical protein